MHFNICQNRVTINTSKKINDYWMSSLLFVFPHENAHELDLQAGLSRACLKW